jgi:hypothetical protein
VDRHRADRHHRIGCHSATIETHSTKVVAAAGKATTYTIPAPDDYRDNSTLGITVPSRQTRRGGLPDDLAETLTIIGAAGADSFNRVGW